MFLEFRVVNSSCFYYLIGLNWINCSLEKVKIFLKYVLGKWRIKFYIYVIYIVNKNIGFGLR